MHADYYWLGIGIAIGMVVLHLWLLINEDDHLR